MPSPFSAAALRAIIFPSHLRCHLLHGTVRRVTDAGLRRIASPNSTVIFAMYHRKAGSNGAARSTSERRSPEISSSMASFIEGEGKCAEGGVEGGGKWEEREEEMDLRHHHHQYGVEEVEGEMNGSYKQVLQQEEGVSYSRLLTLPTVLTLGRVAAVPLLVSTYHMNGSWATTATTGIFIVAAFTDWLDGYLARKMQLGTKFGAFLDPVADKLMVGATLVLLCTKPLEVAFFGVVPWILTVPAIAIIGREITMSAVREWAAFQHSSVLEAVAVNSLGKWKTATQMTALAILLLTRDPSLTGPGFLVSTGVFLLYVSASLALWSLAVYMRKIWRFMIK